MSNGVLLAMEIYDEMIEENLEDHDIDTQKRFIKSVVVLKNFLRSHGKFSQELDDNSIYDIGLLVRTLDAELFEGSIVMNNIP